MLRRPVIAAALAVAATLASGCAGGTPSADLFVVTRTGTIPGAKLTLLLGDGGTVRCNGGPERDITSKQLITARGLLDDLQGGKDDDGPITKSLRLPPGPGSILRYSVRGEEGTVAFSDTSRGQPKVFYEMALFTRQMAKGVCGLPR